MPRTVMKAVLSQAVTRKPRKKRENPEEVLQKAVKVYLDLAAPRLVWWAVPNGGHSKGQNGRNKAMGVRAGVPDLCFLLDSGKMGFVELKAEKGRLSDDQIRFRDLLPACVPYAVCRTGYEVEHTLRGWGVPLRATFGGRCTAALYDNGE